MAVEFSQTFQLKRHTLGKALSGFLANPKMTKQEQMSFLGRGSNEVQGYTRWLSTMGLRDSNERSLTPLGKLLAENDAEAELAGTQWILHYHLCSDPTPQGAEAWYYFVNSFLPLHSRFDRAQLKLSLEQESNIRTENRKGPAADLGLILNCYTTREALGELGIVDVADKTREQYLQGVPRPIPPLIVAYVLYAQREKLYPESSSVSHTEVLTAAGNVGRVFLMKQNQLDNVLVQLQEDGYVTVMNYADLNHVAFVHKGTSLGILKQYYQLRKR